MTTTTLINASTTTKISNPVSFDDATNGTFQAHGTTSSGSGAATVLIQVSNDTSNWITAGTITLTLGTSSTTDGFAMSAPWAYVRANLSAISGTGAAVTVLMGV